MDLGSPSAAPLYIYIYITPLRLVVLQSNGKLLRPLAISQARIFFLDLATLRFSSRDDYGLCKGPPSFSWATIFIMAELHPVERTGLRLGSF